MTKRTKRLSLEREFGTMRKSLFTGGSLGIFGEDLKLINALIAFDRSGCHAGLGESQHDCWLVLKADQGFVCFRG
jgi:hypothetical protein